MKEYNIILNEEEVKTIEEIRKIFTYDNSWFYAEKLEKIILDKIREIKEKEEEIKNEPIKEYKQNNKILLWGLNVKG